MKERGEERGAEEDEKKRKDMCDINFSSPWAPLLSTPLLILLGPLKDVSINFVLGLFKLSYFNSRRSELKDFSIKATCPPRSYRGCWHGVSRGFFLESSHDRAIDELLIM